MLVTGGTGFIGRRLMALLLDRLRPEDITCLVKPPLNERETSAEQTFRAAGVRLISGDLARPEVADVSAPDVDLVFHLAANIDTAASMSDLRVNDLGTDHLLNWLGGGLRGRRIMYTSSVAVVDRNGPARAPIDEATPCTPRTAYGVTKRDGERILRDRAARDGFTWTIVRLPTVYGPGQKPGGMFDLLLGYVGRGALLGRLLWPGRTSVMFVDDVARVSGTSVNVRTSRTSCSALPATSLSRSVRWRRRWEGSSADRFGRSPCQPGCGRLPAPCAGIARSAYRPAVRARLLLAAQPRRGPRVLVRYRQVPRSISGTAGRS